MSLPATVTVNGKQYRGTTAFAKGWCDADGNLIAISAPAKFPPALGDKVATLALPLAKITAANAAASGTVTDVIYNALAVKFNTLLTDLQAKGVMSSS